MVQPKKRRRAVRQQSNEEDRLVRAVKKLTHKEQRTFLKTTYRRVEAIRRAAADRYVPLNEQEQTLVKILERAAEVFGFSYEIDFSGHYRRCGKRDQYPNPGCWECRDEATFLTEINWKPVVQVESVLQGLVERMHGRQALGSR